MATGAARVNTPADLKKLLREREEQGFCVSNGFLMGFIDVGSCCGCHR
jgi:hypothetical protein